MLIFDLVRFTVLFELMISDHVTSNILSVAHLIVPRFICGLYDQVLFDTLSPVPKFTDLLSSLRPRKVELFRQRRKVHFIMLHVVLFYLSMLLLTSYQTF